MMKLAMVVGSTCRSAPIIAPSLLPSARRVPSWRPREGFCRVSASQLSRGDGWERILDRSWLLPSAATKTTKVVTEEGSWFHVIRDDLLHPVMGGNKLRKLDALIPLLQARGVTDVVTCGGCQSAHTAAVAVACAETGMSAHLLLRGERPPIPTGYNLVAGMYGHVSYVPRSEYADRHTMLQKHALQIAGDPASLISLVSKSTLDSLKKVAIINEGAGDCHAILGLIRLVDSLSQLCRCGDRERRLQIVVDCGTGTTAIGLAVGIALYGLPWQVVGVMLADTEEGYWKQAEVLLKEFSQEFSVEVEISDLPLVWRKRLHPRKFGRILPGEVQACQVVARKTGVLLDPIYTLAGWEVAQELSLEGEEVALLHTGGTLGLFGLAQSFPDSNQDYRERLGNYLSTLLTLLDRAQEH